MTDRTRRARSGSGVRRARLEGGKRSGDGRELRLKAGQAISTLASIHRLNTVAAVICNARRRVKPAKYPPRAQPLDALAVVVREAL